MENTNLISCNLKELTGKGSGLICYPEFWLFFNWDNPYYVNTDEFRLPFLSPLGTDFVAWPVNASLVNRFRVDSTKDFCSSILGDSELPIYNGDADAINELSASDVFEIKNSDGDTIFIVCPNDMD
jgi:hypothetical protein